MHVRDACQFRLASVWRIQGDAAARRCRSRLAAGPDARERSHAEATALLRKR